MATPTLYIVSDLKPGHLAQSRGLAQAINRQTPVRIMEIEADGERSAPQPEKEAGLILAAGRETHSMALSLRKYLGVPAIVIMNPGWIGRQRFDLSVIPKHDGVSPGSTVIVTEGAVNALTPATDASPREGLILVGGPSKHHDWDEGAIKQQLETITARDPEMRWAATSSRRTPASTDLILKEHAANHSDRFTYTPASETPEGWVAEQLQRCGVCWVSEDSVSMIYEAMTAGSCVGLLTVPKRSGRLGRVARGVQSLIERGWVSTFEQWQQGKALPTDRPVLAEADRVASHIIERWLAT